MKQGWEIKKLGEVCSIMMGQSPSSDTYNNSEGLPFFQGNADFGRMHPTVRVYCNAPIRIADVGDILISVRAPIGAINISDVKCCIGRGLAAVRGSNKIRQEFIYHSLVANKEKLISQGTGSTFKSISKNVLTDLLIPVPPIAEQEKIVAELDCLSGIIEKKKQQLKELDNLAQSIFYEMFGDPVENDKGWETKSLKNSCVQLFAGGDIPKNNFSKVKTNEHTVPIISNGVGEKALYGYTSIAKVNEACITIAGRGTIGYCEVRDVPFFPVVRLIVAIPKKERLLPIVLRNIIDAHKFKGTGGAIPQLTIPMIKDCSIILPPLALQQEFASKIEAIEKQKELIAQSIKETETLFNSRMDYYFN